MLYGIKSSSHDSILYSSYGGSLLNDPVRFSAAFNAPKEGAGLGRSAGLPPGSTSGGGGGGQAPGRADSSGAGGAVTPRPNKAVQTTPIGSGRSVMVRFGSRELVRRVFRPSATEARLSTGQTRVSPVSEAEFGLGFDFGDVGSFFSRAFTPPSSWGSFTRGTLKPIVKTATAPLTYSWAAISPRASKTFGYSPTERKVAQGVTAATIAVSGAQVATGGGVSSLLSKALPASWAAPAGTPWSLGHTASPLWFERLSAEGPAVKTGALSTFGGAAAKSFGATIGSSVGSLALLRALGGRGQPGMPPYFPMGLPSDFPQAAGQTAGQAAADWLGQNIFGTAKPPAAIPPSQDNLTMPPGAAAGAPASSSETPGVPPEYPPMLAGASPLLLIAALGVGAAFLYRGKK